MMIGSDEDVNSFTYLHGLLTGPLFCSTPTELSEVGVF